MANLYHATPYDSSAAGFYFSTYDEFTERAAKQRNAYGKPVEEYEIQWIEGEGYALFHAIRVSQANLKRWCETFEGLDEETTTKLVYLIDHLGYTPAEALDRLDDVQLFEGTAQEYAEQLLEDTGLLDALAEHLRRYFDTEAFARDLLLGGDISQCEIDGRSWIIQSG